MYSHLSNRQMDTFREGHHVFVCHWQPRPGMLASVNVC
jgi:hypothetical protein